MGMLQLLSLVLIACRPDPAEPPEGSSSSDDTPRDTASVPETGPTGTVAETGDSGGRSTGDTASVGCTEQRQLLDGAVHLALWAAPDGQAVAAGGLGSMTRSVAGVWTEDASLQDLDIWSLDGSSIDEVWVLGRAGTAWRRDPSTGLWVDVGAPAAYGFPAGLHVRAPDDVVIVSSKSYGGPSDLTIHRFDGSDWSEERTFVDSYVEASAVLPDGRLILSTSDGLQLEDGGWQELPAPAGQYGEVRTGEDGTVAALYGSGRIPDQLALGDASGLVDLTPPVTDGHWHGLAVRSASDLWIYGGDIDGPVVMHFDGTSWSEVVMPGDPADYTADIELIDGGVLASRAGELRGTILLGDASGLSVEDTREQLESLDHLAIDRSDGTVYGFGWSGGTAFDGITWSEADLPFPDFQVLANQPVVSDGKMVQWEVTHLAHHDGSVVTRFPLGTEEAPAHLAASDGVFFAVGDLFEPDGPRIGNVGYRHDGTGWASIDLTGLPEAAGISASWADGPDTLWLGVEAGRFGGLALWDNGSASIVTTELDAPPSWMVRQLDGRLWVAAGGSLYAWDGAAFTSIPAPPEARHAHLMPDGTVYVQSYENQQMTIVRIDPDGTQTTVAQDSDLTSLVGHEGLVVSGELEGRMAWWATCEP